MKVLIVDDSRLARVELKQQLESIDGIDEIQEASNIIEAKTRVEQYTPDLLLLDINMPGGDGFQLLDQLDHPPQVIFVTAYDDYALKSFDYDAKDYLLKPVTRERLITALDKLPAYSNKVCDVLTMDSQVFLKDGEHCFFVPLHKIIAFESIGNYSKVYLEAKTPCIYKNLTALESRLPQASFFRASRSWIFNTQYIEHIEASISNGFEVTLKNGLELEISRRQAVLFKQRWSL
ncbi:LytR/AlgR family response regulator transcription factor [Glaciecola sp. 1036]|uniref:LytR/AlgR family response regulator transcription factor n=1 Tax=Alteromonadaceae TaxID=72275 RepID=UPI003D03FF5E